MVVCSRVLRRSFSTSAPYCLCYTLSIINKYSYCINDYQSQIYLTLPTIININPAARAALDCGLLKTIYYCKILKVLSLFKILQKYCNSFED
jgi:hypothetical protein